MGAQGQTTINFGAFPGVPETSVAVTGQGSIVAGSLVEAWMRPEDTADHTADEHFLETIMVMAGNIVAATGFTIYGKNTNVLLEREVLLVAEGINRISGIGSRPGGAGTVRPIPNPSRAVNCYGLWTIAWVWN